MNTIPSIFVTLACLTAVSSSFGKPPPIQAPNGFQVDRVHLVDKKQEGSWVSMCFDPEGKLYVCDQYGKLYRITLKGGKISHKQALASPGMAQGLCWAYGSLYMSVNGGKQGGVYRLTSTANNGEFDQIKHILPIAGSGEHGPHGIIPSPDGKGLYLVIGNHCRPKTPTRSIVSHNWQEDTLLPHLPDASGHAVNVKAPGGTLLYLTPDGKDCEVISTGMRNTYDIAASPDGEIFGYDSDMEWDIGTPWYRPTRVLHLTRGSEFGWRTGTAKWPDYYADSLGAVKNIGPGSPTGVLFGTQAQFPLKYRKALFLLDWTFGRIYAAHLKPEGFSYSAEIETFLTGKPLPLCDAAIGPDGAMYFITGGRRLQSALYRVSYTGPLGHEDTSPMVTQPNKMRSLRNELLQSKDMDTIWQHLDHPDRLMRYNARVALENLPHEPSITRLQKETKFQHIITASLALARVQANPTTIHQKLLSLPYPQLSPPQKLEFLRAVSLTFIRAKQTDPDIGIRYLKLLNPVYPSDNDQENRELCKLLTYLGSSSATGKTVQLMERSVNTQQAVDLELLEGNDRYAKDIKSMMRNQPDANALQYALTLMHAQSGWNQASVTTYFTWLNQAEAKSGGRSYKGFIRNIRKTALTSLPKELKATALAAPKIQAPEKDTPMAQGPGRSWTLNEASQTIRDLSQANKKNGKRMFQATLCIHCHSHGQSGGNSGPDLTNLANRFSSQDILKAIITPSEEISEQYQFTILHLKDGSQLQGKIMKENKKKLWIAPSAFNFEQQVEVPIDTILRRSVSTVSPMPPAMINSLNADELRDLMKFLGTPAP
ncbi:c-type cytochrome [Verrucomicrobiaceae bacterium N1E253]|uniref:C-type cytochrome n=1 Tax=Oceaniferula marina TaxID=2748318 RepID=A0A851GMT4_9BACT|nr:c-type cytochrome [Oceaniferula marina]NWK56140.1 c-type cytochrome [Oceaniferula marina]